MIGGRRDNRKYHFSTFRQYTSNSCRYNIYWTSGHPLWNLWFTWRTSDRKYDNRASFSFRFILCSKYPLTSSTDHWFASTFTSFDYTVIIIIYYYYYHIISANVLFWFTFIYFDKIRILKTLCELLMYYVIESVCADHSIVIRLQLYLFLIKTKKLNAFMLS